MNILLLRGFNNYFNRTVKKYSTLADYRSNSSSYLDLANINFNPNDGVATELIIGSVNQKENNAPLDWENIGTPDYLVCYENNIIKFRWFVLESERTRAGQYRIALKRDVIADNINAVLNAPCFVEKGYITNKADPLIFNPEGFSVNQIKQSEDTIKDETDCAWLVGYVKKDAALTEFTATRSSDESQYDSLSSLPFDDTCINFFNKDGTNTAATQTIIDNALTYPRAYFSVYQSYWSLKWGWFYFAVNPYSSALTAYKYTNNSGYFAGKNENFMNTTSAALNCNKKYDNWNQGTNNDLYVQDMNTVLSDVATSAWIASKDAFIAYIFNKSLTSNNLVRKNNIDLLSYNGKIVEDAENNKLYKLSITLSSDIIDVDTLYDYSTDTIVQTFFQDFASKLDDTTINSGSPSNIKLDFKYAVKTYSIVATEVDSPTSLKIRLPGTGLNRNATNDALYDIFCIPYNPNGIVKIATAGGLLGPTTVFNEDADDAIFVAQQIMKNLGTDNAGKAYDLQLLPYCPLTIPTHKNLLNGSISLCAYELDSASYTIISNASDANKVAIFYPTEANFTKTIAKTIKHIEHDLYEEGIGPETVAFEATNPPYVFPGYTVIGSLAKPDYWTFPFTVTSSVLKINGTVVTDFKMRVSQFSQNIIIYLKPADYPAGNYSVELILNIKTNRESTPLELKVFNESEFMRLTSPNFNSMFEFKLSKFTDGIHSINIDCSYKPFSPYIKLNPDFSGLYGSDFNDSTGLILAGDFSLAIMSDPWINYQLNNKNYQQIFNRQIENLDISNQIAQEKLQFNNALGLLTGTLGGAVGGAISGAKTGSYGAIIGAAVSGLAGGALASAKGTANQEWLNRQQAESRSFAIDMYNYQLGNIKALPATITKSDPLTYNNKIWPILEVFSCTEKEKEVIKNKLIYDGMTVMAIGNLKDYAVSAELDRVFVKGQLIRAENIADDFHVVDAIYQEVNKGFFIIQGE